MRDEGFVAGIPVAFMGGTRVEHHPHDGWHMRVPAKQETERTPMNDQVTVTNLRVSLCI
jgi:hypothetical protein